MCVFYYKSKQNSLFWTVGPDFILLAAVTVHWIFRFIDPTLPRRYVVIRSAWGMCWQPCSLSLKAVLQMEDHNGQWISLTPLPMRQRVMKRWLTLDRMEGWKRPYVCTVGGFRPSGSLLLLSFYYLTIIVNNIVNYVTGWQHILHCSYGSPNLSKLKNK